MQPDLNAIVTVALLRRERHYDALVLSFPSEIPNPFHSASTL